MYSKYSVLQHILQTYSTDGTAIYPEIATDGGVPGCQTTAAISGKFGPCVASSIYEYIPH